MSKQVLLMKYHPAKKEVRFQRFQNGEENSIRDDSKLKGYMNKSGVFVLQYQGNHFLTDIAETFDGEQHVQINVVTTKNDYEDFEQMVEFYNADNPPVRIDITLLSELPDMEKTFHAVKEHGERSLVILRKNRMNFFEVLKDTNNASVKKSVEAFAADVQKEIDSINEKITAIADNNVNLCFTGVYSSGKSALINAIIGYRILPEDIRSETARMFRIKSPKPEENVRIEFLVRADYAILVWNKKYFEFAAGPVENATREAIQNTINMNKDKLQHDQIYEILKTLNDTDGISAEIFVYFPIPLDNDKVQFTIYDTPGADSNYGDHQNVLQDALSVQTHSILIFVAAPNKMEGEGNNALLNYIKEAENKDSKTSIDIGRSLFVINWADTIPSDAQKALQTEKIKNKEDPDFQIALSDKKLFFTSAMYAYAAVAIKNKIAEPNHEFIIEDDYSKILRPERGQYFLQNRCATSELATRKQHDISKAALEAAKAKNDRTEIFHICSGMFSLENEIILYGEKFAAAVRAFAIIDSVDKALKNMNGKACLLESKNRQDIENVNKEIEELRLTMKNSIKQAYKEYAISIDESLPKKILTTLKLNAEYINETLIDRPKSFINKLLRGWFFGHGKVFFKEKHKKEISQKLKSVYYGFESDFLEGRQKLLGQQRDGFINAVKEIIRNNGNISEEAKIFVLDIRPPEIKKPDNIDDFGKIYENFKRDDKFLWVDIETVDKDSFIKEIEGKLTDIAKDLADGYKSDFQKNLKSILIAVENEFTGNLDKYSVIVKARLEDKKAMEQLRSKIFILAKELSTCQEELGRIIWNEKNNEQ